MREWAAEGLADPNLAFVCLAVGFAAALWELCHPGAVLPGACGGVLMLLGLWHLFRHPTRPGALVLMVAGVALVVAAPFVSRILSWAGGVCVLAGFAFLLDRPLGIHPILLLTLGVPCTGLSAFLWNLAVSATRYKAE